MQHTLKVGTPRKPRQADFITGKLNRERVVTHTTPDQRTKDRTDYGAPARTEREPVAPRSQLPAYAVWSPGGAQSMADYLEGKPTRGPRPEFATRKTGSNVGRPTITREYAKERAAELKSVPAVIPKSDRKAQPQRAPEFEPKRTAQDRPLRKLGYKAPVARMADTGKYRGATRRPAYLDLI
jgi:hypothetical protein